MSTRFNKNLVAVAILGLAAADSAQAEVKGVSINEITDFTITTVGGSSIGFEGTGTFDITFQNPLFESSASANNRWGSVTDSDPSNVPLQCVGPPEVCAGIAENTFSQVGNVDDPNLSGPIGVFGDGDESVEQPEFARGDAQIINPNVLTGGAASNVAEISVPYPINEPGAQGNGTNSLNADMVFTVNTTDQIEFNFDAAPFIETFSGFLDDYPGTGVTASMSFSITIQDDAGGTIFGWAPTGAGPGGTVGGTVGADDASLNLSVVSNEPGEWRFYDPVNDDSDCGVSSCGYTATTFDINPGTYALNIRMNENVSGQQVPEPATFALMGLGLAGLSAARRRRKV